MDHQKEAGVFTTVSGLVEQFTDNPAARLTAQELSERLRQAEQWAVGEECLKNRDMAFGILKQGFLGRPMRAKGFDHREMALAWGVLTHNLWMLARMRKTQKKKAVPLPKAA